MTRPGRRVGLAASAYLLFVAPSLLGQTEGSLGVGATRVEYEGFLSTGAVVVAPSVLFDTPRLSLGAQGSWSVFQSGRGVLQGSVSAAWLAGTSSRWRVELSGGAGGSKYADFGATGYLLGGARFHLLTASSGAWVGIQSGLSDGGPGGAPVEISVAGWSVKDRVTVTGIATTTFEGAVRALDLAGGIRWIGAKVTLEARAGARRSTQSPAGGGTDVYGEATGVLPVTRRIAVWVGGGRYPSDPVRHTVGARYLSAGVQLHAARRSIRGAALPHGGILRGRTPPADDGGPALEVAGLDERRTLRVRVTDAATVEVMADFTDWIPVALVQRSKGTWETQVSIPAGLHRVNVRVDGGAWMAPRGARQERTEFGGLVGIVVVP